MIQFLLKMLKMCVGYIFCTLAPDDDDMVLQITGSIFEKNSYNLFIKETFIQHPRIIILMFPPSSTK